MEYLKSAFERVTAMSGVSSLMDWNQTDGESGVAVCPLYEGNMSAKVILEYIEQNQEAGGSEEGTQESANTASSCSKEQFMKIEIHGSNEKDLSSYVRKSGYTHVIIAVDQSGSMSGSPLNQVKQALIYLLEETSKQDNIIVDIFTYYQKISSVKYTQINYKEKVNAIKAGGRTYFNIVFDKIREVAKTKVGGKEVKKTVVVFMTDGADTSGEVGPLKRAQKKCMAHLKTTPQATVVHVVGFSKDHDYKFMNEINHLGKQEGLFRYCEPGDGPEALRDKLAELFDLITASGQEFFDVEVHVPDGLRIVTSEGFTTKRLIPLRLQTSNEERTGEDDTTQNATKELLQANTWVYVETEDPVPRIDIKVLQSVNGEKIPIECEVVEVCGQAVTKPVEKVEWSLNILERNIDLITAKIGEAILKRKDLTNLEGRLAKLQHKVSETKIYDFRVKKEDRKFLLEHVAALQTKLDALHKMIAEVKRGECHQVSMLARANDLRYQVQFSKTRRHRLMDQRIRVNAEKMKKAQAELDKVGVNKEEIEELSIESTEFYTCTLSHMSIREIMFDLDDKEDCLGFGLAVKRPEHVLDEPTAVRIWSVSGTFVSRSSMMDALHYKIDVEGHLMAHGGFNIDTELGVATVGLSREPINAWLPMYICDSHWQRVKFLLKPTLGYFCTLDPLGYNYKQADVLFQVLGSMIGQLEPANCSTHQLKMIFAFQRLCIAVVKDFDLEKPIMETVQNFLAGPAGRTKDIVPNLFVLFGYIVCLPRDKLETLFGADSKERSLGLQGLWLSILTESLRRAAGSIYRETSDAQTDGILHALISAGLCHKGNSKQDLSDAELLQTWKATCTYGLKDIDIPAYQMDSCVTVPEVTVPERNSDKVDKAMEVWAQAKCGIIRNKNQEENVKKAAAMVKKWVSEGHQNMDAAVTSQAVAVDTGQIIAAKEEATDTDKGASESTEKAEDKEIEEVDSEEETETPREWTKESIKHLVSILQVIKKLTKVMYPRIGNITGYMAYVSFWLKHMLDYTEIDRNSGVPPTDWIQSVKSAVTKLHSSITEKGKNIASEKPEISGLTKDVVDDHTDAGAWEPADDDDLYYEVEESAEQQLQKKYRDARSREPNICEVLCMIHSGNSIDLLCAMLSQAVKYSRNTAARTAAADGTMLDLKTSRNIQLTLNNVKKAFEEKEKAAILGAIEKVFWQRSNYAMLQAPTVWSFIGYLMNTYKDRGEGLAEFLKILTSKERPVDVPVIAEKVKIILNGKYKDHVVLSNGNIWMPEKKVAKKFAEALGQETWEAIEVDLLSNVAIHVYRESDIPNRHGHCNSNPYIPNALRRKLGMELLPEKPSVRRSKIKNKYTR